MNTTLLDPATEHAAQVFLERIAGRYRVVGAILFGSRGRHTQRHDSDTDLAVLLPGAAIRLNGVTPKPIGGKSDENHND